VRRHGKKYSKTTASNLEKKIKGLKKTNKSLISQITERKRVEQALRESEEEVKAIFNSVNDSVAIIDLTGKVTMVNKRMIDVGGYTEEEIIGKRLKFLKMFTPQSIAKMLTNLSKLISGQEAPIFDVEVYTKAGEKINAELRGSLLKKGGKVKGVIGVMRDITERKQAEEALQKNEEKYRNLFDNARDVIVTFDLKGNVISINKAVEDYGFKVEEIVGKNMLKFISREYHSRLIKELAKIIRGKNIEEELELTTTKGEKIAEYKSNPMIEGNKVFSLQTMLRDITERKQAEEALRNSEKDYRELFENMMDGLIVHNLIVDNNGKPVDYILEKVNSAAERIMSWKREDKI